MRPKRMTAMSALYSLLVLSPASVRAEIVVPRGSGAPLPYREAGLSEREAAAHLLDRLAYGARPGEIDRVVAMGIEAWMEVQLAANAQEGALARFLTPLPALAMSPRSIVETYPPNPALLRMAEEAGVIERQRQPGRESVDADPADAVDRREQRRKVAAWMEREGLKSERVLVAQSYAQKLLRAVYAENQLQEVLADFWFNHFNVSITDNAVRNYLLTYERDAIRPHLTGSFRELLESTAKHPAMLAYLDNFQSIANPGQPTLAEARDSGAMAGRGRGRGAGGTGGGPGMSGNPRRPGGGLSGEMGRRAETGTSPPPRPNRPQGLNENYARELLELHTLGVDGGYTQTDVVEVARAFTGWTFLPAGRLGEEGRSRLERARRAGMTGFVTEGEFLFRADGHDAAAKSVLGVALPRGRGIEDGERVLDLVASHPATARHLATKLAARFIADEPNAALVDRLAATFTATKGDLGAMIRAIVSSPEFWAKEHRGQKIKSPFEVVVSSLRALGAEVDNPFPALEWVAKMGQPLYAYQAPTGFPDRADFWVNTGSLLARMNFGLELAAGRIPGIRFDFARLSGEREPESPAAALEMLATRFLPEREIAPTIEQLEPLLTRDDLSHEVAARAPEAPELPAFSPEDELGSFADLADPALAMGSAVGDGLAGPRERRAPGDLSQRRQSFERLDFYPAPVAMHTGVEPPTVFAGVAGLVLGSPEFQRR